MPHLLISAAHKSSGKTTVALGLCAALRERGLTVQPFKKGPDYIDPIWLGTASGRDCHNLDFHTMGDSEILATFARLDQAADICLIEGNKGLHDGLSVDGNNSNAALAKLVGAPVVLVIDASGMTRGIAPLLLGYQAFDPAVRIAGVILNRVAGSRHEGKLRESVAHYTDIPVLGAVARSAELSIVERHLGLTPCNELGAAASRAAKIGEIIADQVDVERIVSIARTASRPAGVISLRPPVSSPPDVRIGIASDKAFGFYYPGDLDALRAAGAELVFIDTLRDADLPMVDGLFIGGGFPETQMRALEANQSLRSAIRREIENGLPVYAECGGLMYLARGIRWGEQRCEMVGALPADVLMHDRPQGRGYVRLRDTGMGPWPLPVNRGVTAEIHAHEFHHSSLINLAPGLTFAYEVLRGRGVDGKRDGIVYRNTVASYAHLRDVNANHWAERFVGFVRACRQSLRPINVSSG